MISCLDAMQPQQPPPLVHGCRRRVSLALLISMLSSSTSFSKKPNPSFLHRTMKSTSDPSSRTPKLPPPLFANIPPHFSSPNFCQNTLSFSKCFSATTTTTNPIPILNNTGPATSIEEGKFEESSPLVVVSFYKFADFPDHALLRKPLKDLCERLVTFSSSSSSSFTHILFY